MHGNTQICGLCDPAPTSAPPIEQMKTPYDSVIDSNRNWVTSFTLVTYPVHPPTSTSDYLQ
jgi:hypothetical protein